MKICVPCKEEMNCDRNGIGVYYGHGHVYPADRYKCPKCGTMILLTNERPIYDPERKTQDEYFKMNPTED